jgi:hypothetical protein
MRGTSGAEEEAGVKPDDDAARNLDRFWRGESAIVLMLVRLG